jgi:hypothetical protein
VSATNALPDPAEPYNGMMAGHRVVVSLWVAALIAAACSGRPAPPASTSASGSPVVAPRFQVVRVDPGSGRAVGWIRQLRGDNNALAVTAGQGALWVATSEGVARIDPGTRDVDVVGLGGTPYSVAVGLGAVWAAGAGDRAWRIDPGSHSGVALGVALNDSREHWVATDAQHVWIANFRTGVIQQVDPSTGRQTGSVTVPGGIATAMAAGLGAAWVVDGLQDAAVRIDPRNVRIAGSVALPATGTAIAVGGGRVWVSLDKLGEVVEIDPVAMRIGRTIRVGHDAPDIAVGLGALWVGHRNGTLTRVPLAGGHADEFQVSTGPIAGVAPDRTDHTVWVTVCPSRHACGAVGPRIAGHGQ